MTFLLMDTSGEMCVLALAEEDGTVQAVSIFEGKRTLSRRLMGEIEGLLSRNGLTLGDVSAFGVGIGPGSFTGVRVGVTTAKTLAQVTGKPLVGVGTLEAYGAVSSGLAGRMVAVLPSRRGEVYAAIYQEGECVEAPFAEGIDALTARLDTLPDVILCGDVRQLPGWSGKALAQAWTPPAGMTRIAAQRLAAGDTDDFLSLVPLYVVAPSISVKKPTPSEPTPARSSPPLPRGEGKEIQRAGASDYRAGASPAPTPHPPVSGGPQRSGEVGSGEAGSEEIGS